MKIKENIKYDVIGIGSALLDFTIEVDDQFLTNAGLVKGEMSLIDEKRSSEIFSLVENLPVQVTPGGSAANTIAGVASLGGKALLMGKVGKDKNGDIYIKETGKSGVKSVLKRGDLMTGHAITFITPDSERTFATHLGAALMFNPNDVDTDSISDSGILHLEGYLFEPPVLREACIVALKAAKESGTLVSIDLSDPGLIERIKETFDDIIKNYCDIIFVNEDEAKAFTGKDELEALHSLSELCDYSVVKIGSRGSLIKTDSTVYEISPEEVEVVNTNGAGDAYAAGILSSIVKGKDPKEAGKVASHVSSVVVSQVAARFTKEQIV